MLASILIGSAIVTAAGLIIFFGLFAHFGQTWNNN
jgi:hypothetical protein